MAGLDPAIHVGRPALCQMAHVDARTKSGHDERMETVPIWRRPP